MEYTTTADVRISDPVRYMKRLCRHFGHKVDVTIADELSTVRFGGALAELNPIDEVTLRMVVRADSADDAARYAGVVDRHLVKFAFRETLEIAWSEPDVAAAAAG